MKNVFVIDDDRILARTVAKIVKDAGAEVLTFGNVYDAVRATNEQIPDLIFLDILLDGPDGFSLLNELASYEDTEGIPIVVMTSLEIGEANLKDYGVVGVLRKDKMTPEEVRRYVRKYTK